MFPTVLVVATKLDTIVIEHGIMVTKLDTVDTTVIPQSSCEGQMSDRYSFPVNHIQLAVNTSERQVCGRPAISKTPLSYNRNINIIQYKCNKYIK